MALTGTDEQKFRQLSSKTYKDQAIWFLNAYWGTFGEKEAEKLWKFKHKCDELDLNKRSEGSALDELNAHRFLEAFNEPMTVREMRDALRATGATGSDKFTTVPLTHFLVSIYKVNWKQLVNASQGDNKAEIEHAQRLFDEVQVAFQESETKHQQAAAALKESHAREAEARTKEAEAKTREEEAEAAKRELEAALADLKAKESEYNNKTQDLTKKSESASGVVAQNKAKAELAQHLNEPTMPLRKARITQEAAVKKAEKTKQAAADARAAAEAAVHSSVQARKASEAAKAAAEAAVEAAKVKVDEAEAYLQEVKAKPGNAQGSLWWLERELHEARAFLPEKKGGYKKTG